MPLVQKCFVCVQAIGNDMKNFYEERDLHLGSLFTYEKYFNRSRMFNSMTVRMAQWAYGHVYYQDTVLSVPDSITNIDRVCIARQLSRAKAALRAHVKSITPIDEVIRSVEESNQGC
jgi:hypothetical protein